MNNIPQAKPKSWLIWARQWHIWAGLGASVFLLFFAVSGIYLNHKKTFEEVAGRTCDSIVSLVAQRQPAPAKTGEHTTRPTDTLSCSVSPLPGPCEDSTKKPKRSPEAPRSDFVRLKASSAMPTAGTLPGAGNSSATLNTQSSPTVPVTGPLSFEDALAVARSLLGKMAAIKAIEHKQEHGDWYYKIKTVSSGELLIHADSGEVSRKAPKPEHDKKPEKDKKPDHDKKHQHQDKHEEGEKKYGPGAFGKLIKDLHTGKVGGIGGRLFNDAVAVVLIFLALGGCWMWWTTQARKNAGAARRAEKTEKGNISDDLSNGIAKELSIAAVKETAS